MPDLLPVFASTVIGLQLSLLGLWACSPADPNASHAPDQRVVAIGDLHGDLDATRRALRLAGAIDAQDQWAGHNLIVVQTGDQVDRGDQDREVLDLLEKLVPQAEAAGGKLYILNGNHEVMNTQADFRYISPASMRGFERLEGVNMEQPHLKLFPPEARGRAAAFLPGGPYARQLGERKTVLLLGGTVFVHGGLLPEHVDYGLERLNQEYQQWFKAEKMQLPAILNNESSPIWNRFYSNTEAAPECELLNKTLSKLGAKRMVVGHTVQATINSACEGKVWRIDTGMSRAYGGPVQVLEMMGEQVKVLKEQSAEKTQQKAPAGG